MDRRVNVLVADGTDYRVSSFVSSCSSFGRMPTEDITGQQQASTCSDHRLRKGGSFPYLLVSLKLTKLRCSASQSRVRSHGSAQITRF